MKKIYLAVFSILATGGLMAQSAVNMTSVKQEVRTSADANSRTRTVYADDREADDIIWEDDFSDAGMWTAGGPGGDFDTYGWTIGTAIEGWYGGFDVDMGTDGNFARFQNGNTDDFLEAGGFTLTYTGSLDLSGIPAPHIEFDQYGAIFFEVQAVEVSIDGGASWVQVGDNSDIDPLVLGGGDIFGHPELRRYNITEAIAGGEDDVMIRLFWDGAMNGPGMNYISYGWYVDNIRVVEGHPIDSDIQASYIRSGIGTSFEFGLDYYTIAQSQVPGLDITFAAKTINQGGSTFEGLHLVAEVDKGGVVYTGTSTDVDLAPGAEDSLGTTDAYTPDAGLGTYNVSWSFEGDDVDPYSPNDAMTSSFRLTEYHYGRDNGIANGSISNVGDNSGNPLSIGNVMDIFADATIYSIDVDITDAADNEGAPIYGQIMIYNDDAGDYEYIDQTSDYDITNDDLGGTIKLFFEDPIDVEAGDVVLVLAGHYGAPDVGFSTAQAVEEGTLLGYTDAGLFRLLNPNAIMVRLDFEEEYDEEDPGDGAVENISAAFNISQNIPNPFNANTRINYSLLEAGNVSIEFVDVTGKLVQSINKGVQSAGDYNVVVDGTNFAEGIYFYTFTVGNEKITKRMVVTK
ncbi:T9SS type A sorting domain-containing protein [Crocinitomix catalasitica]|uniref:T9SS type A sorting domain-containing protein n=1 Tax=Crocinitomix catalasitica TaxID=184607 RepID=UPI0004872B41|nr:T9SS type A sorting domain-containing protein [Crocinitomix catalasitica]